jgi:tetratricopeptide (TPR) repeat protein/serine phosphatase RsbU (regulator of sigma subunit)
MKKLLTIALILFSLQGMAQLSPKKEAKIDSLKQVVATATHDTIIIKALIAWDNIIWRSDPNLDIELNEKMEALCAKNLKKKITSAERAFYVDEHSTTLNNLGGIYFNKGDYNKALDYFNQSLKVKKKIGDKRGVSMAHTNIGSVYKERGNYIKALEHYAKALKIEEERGDKQGAAGTLNNIGMLYQNQEEFESALDYFTRSCNLYKEINTKRGIAITLNNMGGINRSMGNIEKARELFKQSLKIREEINDKKGISGSLVSIGISYQNDGDYDTAIDYFNKSVKISADVGNKIELSNAYINLGLAYKDQGLFAKSIDYGNQALALGQESGDIINVKRAAESLIESYKATNNHKQALKMFELYITSKDSIQNEANQKEMIRQEYKYDYEKQHLSDSLGFKREKEVEQLAHDAELEKEEQQRYVLYGGLGFLLLLGGMAFRGYQRKRKDNILITEQKEEVELQKEIVEEKNTEILDSITYAKRIQEAILPPTRLVKEWLPNSFILYKPKDIVAGDFYWMENIGDTIIFAAADCTGHGVPGAMVSVVCHNAMNRAVREFGLREPGKILDKTRELVVRTFEKSEEEVKDGMDIALCSMSGNKLQYAGANNPLWIIRNGEVLETKATKQPIGKVDNPQPFTTHTFELQQGDVFYIFSDGYVDQFGGRKGKKFKAKAFRELLLSIQDRNMEEQRMLINEAFEQWRGDLEQVDDVCVIGVNV